MVERLVPVFCVKIRSLEEAKKYKYTKLRYLLDKHPYMGGEWMLIYSDGDTNYVDGHTYLFSYFYSDVEEDLEVCKKRFPHLFI